EVDYYAKDNDDYVNGEGFCCGDEMRTKSTLPSDNVDYEKLQYYYHPDHLGSASYITNLDGEVVQHIEYVPFGEVFLEERNNTWNTPYLFNGKELDEETGLYYYGARYYNPRVSLWYGVDPHASSYPGVSPYAYVLNNPINAIDPDGRDVILLIDKQGAGGRGHMGMLYQDGNGSWYYFSQGATGNPSTSGMVTSQNTAGGVTLIKLQVTETVAMKDSKGNPILDANGNAMTKQVTRDATEAEALAGAKSGQLGTAYDDSYKITTSSKEDAQIHTGATKVANDHNSGKSEYNLYFNNCVDACQDAVQSNTRIDMPTDYSPVPNSYFDKVKENGVTRKPEPKPISKDNNPGALKPWEPKL
ncbi:MAG: RHS repeat domain-containing protein, partial [Bacteroidales bacterium]